MCQGPFKHERVSKGHLGEEAVEGRGRTFCTFCRPIDGPGERHWEKSDVLLPAACAWVQGCRTYGCRCMDDKVGT